MAIENFLSFTEIDPNTRIAVTASRVTWTLLTADEDAYVYKDKGVNYFSGNFEIQLTYRLTGGTNSGSSVLGICSLTNLVDDLRGIDVANGDYLTLRVSRGIIDAGSFITIEECDGGAVYGATSAYMPINLNTDYYLTFTRDENVGTYGTLYLYIYSDVARTTLLDTLSLALHTSKKDFRYIYACQSIDNNEAALTHSGYTEALEITNASTPTVTTQAVTAISGTTATGNGNITNLGYPNPTQHGHCWNTTGAPTIADSKTQNGAGVAGAFTSAITGLTAGTKYYVRAYATNSIGTSYGDDVEFISAYRYQFNVKNINLPYEDLDKTKELHIVLTNLSPTTKLERTDGAIKVKIDYEPAA